MRVNGGSDLARLQVQQRQALATRSRLDIAAEEMTSGQRADRVAATGGNLTRLTSLERSLARNASFSATLSLTETRLDTMQASLGAISARTSALAVGLTDAAGKGDVSAAMLQAKAARVAFTDAVAKLNVEVGGQSLFAGAATDRPALAGADAMLADLDALAAGAATAADASAAIDAWFARPGGGFFATGYLGSTTPLTAVDIGEGERLDAGVTADADRLIAVLKAQAKAAVVAGGAFASSEPDRLALVATAGREMLVASEGILALSAEVGFNQETVATAKAARTAENDTLSKARVAIIAADPMEAATNYQALETQLQSIYTLTARLAGLHFLNFMK